MASHAAEPTRRRPVSGVGVIAPRIETVELDPEDLDRGLGKRFLAAGEVPDEEASSTLAEARAAAASAGSAVIEVTFDDCGVRARLLSADAIAPAASA
jgi:hypothetical protein